MKRAKLIRMAVALPALLILASCGARPRHEPPAVPSVPGARCQVRASADRPLIVEWDAASRNDVESLLKSEGAVVVRYNGCEMELMRNCRAPGNYKYLTATRQTESFEIRTADELYARLPIGAVTLEGELQRSGELRLDLSIVGKYHAANAVRMLDRFQGTNCDGATHVVVGLTAGAFEMSSGTKRGGSVGVVLAGASSSREEQTLRRAGDRAACDKSTLADGQPPAGCGALLRLELLPVECPPSTRLLPGKGCTGSTGDVVSLGSRGPSGENHPSAAAFTRLVLDAAEAVRGALQGAPADPSMKVSFRDLEEDKQSFEKVGKDAKVLLVNGVVGMLEVSEERKRSAILVDWVTHANGQGRWGRAKSVEIDKPDVSQAAPLDKLPDPMKSLYQHLLQALQGPCELSPSSKGSDFKYINPDIEKLGNFEKEDGDIRVADPDALKKVCPVAKKANTWLGAFPRFEVAIGNNRNYARVRMDIAATASGYLIDARIVEVDRRK